MSNRSPMNLVTHGQLTATVKVLSSVGGDHERVEHEVSGIFWAHGLEREKTRLPVLRSQVFINQKEYTDAHHVVVRWLQVGRSMGSVLWCSLDVASRFCSRSTAPQLLSKRLPATV